MRPDRRKIFPWVIQLVPLRGLRERMLCGWAEKRSVAGVTGRGQAKRRSRRQVLAVPKHVLGCVKLFGAPLPVLDRKIVANGNIVEPIRAILAEPNLAVFALGCGKAVAQILAAAVVAADIGEQLLGGLLLRLIVLLSDSPGVFIGDFLRELEFQTDKIEPARAEIHGRERIGLGKIGILLTS